MGDASTSGCTPQLEVLELADTSCTKGGSRTEPDLVTTPSSSGSRLPTESSCVSSAAVEERIQQSKSHWSTLTYSTGANEEKRLRSRTKWQKFILPCSKNGDEETAEESNVRVFKELRRHPKWGFFFDDEDGFAEFVVGDKFAEGAQADLHHVRVVASNPEWNEYALKRGIEYVLKVFKKGTFLQDLQLQVPRGYLDFRAEFEKLVSGIQVPRFQSSVIRGVLLKDGQFAFLMVKEHYDLRHVIERNMKSSSGGIGPFSKDEAECIMYEIALGVDWLHKHNVIHRDLKASNVLVKEYQSGYPKYICSVADFECSIGVIGIGFFRAPEVLQACKERKLKKRPKVFSKAADIYSYGMVCFEILTGKLPFEGHPQNDYDVVLNGQRVKLPSYVEDWTCELLNSCWHLNPSRRPKIREIINLFLVNSRVARKHEQNLKEEWGQNYRDKSYMKTSNS